MKMNKKTIIILIVVAVAVYLLWKRVKESQAVVTSSGSGLSKYSVDDVIKAAGLTGSRAQTIREECNWLNTQLTWRAQIEDKAEERGRSYEQQLVIEALYAFHYHKDDAIWKISASQFETYWHAIDAM